LAQTLARESENDPDLARLLELWERLPEGGRRLLRQTAETLCGELSRAGAGVGWHRGSGRAGQKAK
jgi:hypothetical protein